MTKQIKSKGFTIVELLIVIVVIAILAAITIVAYNGIQQRAKASAAQSAAETVQKKAEAANAITSSYPLTETTTGTVPAKDFESQQDSSLKGSGVTFVSSLTAGTAPSATASIVYKPCTNPSGAGATISYYDPSKASASTVVTITIGNTCTTYATNGLTGGPF